MAEINSEATCGGEQSCPFYHHMEDADVLDTEPGRPIMCAWGHCQRFPKWERKNPTTPACGEHPQYFYPTLTLDPDSIKMKYYPDDKVIPGWIDTATGNDIETAEALCVAQKAGTAIFGGPGKVINMPCDQTDGPND